MKTRALTYLLCLSLGACAPIQTMEERLATLPVVKLGDTPPAGDFVLRLPGGEPILARTDIVGTLFAQEGTGTVEVRLKHDLYLYKQWLSYDRVHWEPANRRVVASLKVTLPSTDHPEPGVITLRLDEK